MNVLDASAPPATGVQTAKEESGTMRRLLQVTGLGLLGAGWLLPWFVNPTSSGVGPSLQDAISHGLSGVATIPIYLVGGASLMMIAAFGYEVIGRRFGLGRVISSRVLAVAALIGALSTLLTWYLVDVIHAGDGFGVIAPSTWTNSAVWMTLTGFLISAFTYALRDWVGAHGNVAFAIVAFGFGGAFPLIFNHAGDFIVWGAASAGIYTLLALGLNVVVGFAGLLDLGYAAFYAIGAYTTASLASSAHHIHLPFWILIFLGAAVASLFGAILGAPTLRLRGDYLAIVTLGFGEIVPDMAQNNILGLTGGPNGISGIDSPAFPTHGNALIDFGLLGVNPTPYFYSLLVLIALIILVLRNSERSRLGRAWVAIREDEVAAASVGVNPITTKLLAFSIGASVSGFAGAFFGAMFGNVSPDTFQFAVSITALSTVVLGGIGNIAGVTVGAAVITFVIFWMLPHLQSWLGTVGSTVHLSVIGEIDYSRFQFILYGLILIGIMLLRPGGLIPSRARKVELETETASESLAAVRGIA
jgi:branched-chain amino acid transport system permease protein